MKLETIKKDKKKRIIIGSMVFLSVVVCLTLTTTRAKYRNVQSIKLANGVVDYKAPDLKLAIKVSEDGVNYTSQSEIPTGDYTFNAEKSKCRIPTSTLNGENAPVDNSATIEYVGGKLNFKGLTHNDTKCYVYFYKTPDTEVPTISNVATTVTKTEINVTVTASDNNGVTEYWYGIGGGTLTQGTGNTHTFEGLTAGQTYTIKVMVKDAAGNPSAEYTASVTTTPNGQTSSTIIADIEKGSSFKSGVPNFMVIAKGAETEDNNGIYKVEDGMYSGYSYYWRGAATTNHVIFDNMCWRIVRINGDKSIRLIYNGAPSGTTCSGNGKNSSSVVLGGTAYNTGYKSSSYVGWTYITGGQRPSTTTPQTSGTASSLKTALENWYSSISATAKNKVATGYFCNDRNTKDNEAWIASGTTTQYYAAYARLIESKEPTLSCPSGDVYSSSVGMITADEVTFAGASGETSNKLYYLYNGQNYWTMSPGAWDYSSAAVFYVYCDNGGLTYNGNVNSTVVNVRPVINLKANTQFNEGSDGTQNNPYIVQ